MFLSFTFLSLIFLSTLHFSFCLEHLTYTYIASGAGTILSAALYSWQVHFSGHEFCGSYWNKFNATEFRSHFQEHLYGQHLVTWIVPQSLRAHVSKESPQKALVMSFHGWTGSGKNYASKIIADALYEKGQKSEFVHWYIATKDFPHLSEVRKYRDRLQREIPEYTKKCGQSLFIFDEMDKMDPGIIDAIKPFIDFHEEIDGIDYRKNIYIFLSNAGGSEITRIAFNFWVDGKDREDINMRDIEPLVNQGAFNEKGGLYFSEIVAKNLIDVYVPFLPLEKSHVKKCIEQELKIRGQSINKKIVEKVAKQIIYYPIQFELYSISGCKKISHKVDIFGSEEL